MNPWLDRYLQAALADPNSRWIFWTAIVFFSLGLLLILFLLVSRVTKTLRSREKEKLRGTFQGILNSIVVNELQATTPVPKSALEYYLSQLRSTAANRTFANDLLIRLIISLKKNLTGSSAEILKTIYFSLGLEHRSRNKLKSFRWKQKAEGIRELGEMQHTDSLSPIVKFLNSWNTELREESLMALARLNEKSPLAFLDQFQSIITPWMTLNIHAFLQKLDPRQLPDFSKWFSHTNTSVRLFALRMAIQFRQTHSVPGMVLLLDDSEIEIKNTALRGIGEMEAREFSSVILERAEEFTNHKSTLRAFLFCAGRIFDGPQVDFVKPFMEHRDYEIRFEAAMALKTIGSQGRSVMDEFVLQHPSSTALVKHIYDPFLN